jgi:tetratricopeptide (TPR) repeat protein
VSSDLASTRSPSRAARAKAVRLIDQADRIAAQVLHPDSWEADARARRRFLSGDEFERFLRLYLDAMDLDPVEPAYPWNLASALRRLGRSDLALGFIGRAVKTGEHDGDDDWADADAYLVWAETAIEAGQEEVALAVIARATEKAHGDPDARAHALRLLTYLASRPVATGARRTGWSVVVPIGTEDAATPEDTSEQIAKRTMDTLTRAVARAAQSPRPARRSKQNTSSDAA